MVGHPKI